MNSTPQLELHPDTGELNAFVEQLLTAPERERLVGHLAGCSRCREVVFLARQAAAEEEAPVAVSQAELGRAWFANWRWAWTSAAALAAVVTLVVTFYLRPSGFRPHPGVAAPQVAKLLPGNEPRPPASVLGKPARAKAAHAALAPTGPKASPKGAQTARAPVAGDQFSAAPAMSGFLSLQANPAPPPPGSAGSGSAVAGRAIGPNAVLFKPQPSGSPWPQQTLQRRATSAAAVQSSHANLRPVGSPRTAAAASFASVRQPGEIQPGNSLQVAIERPMIDAPLPAGIAGIQLPNGAEAVSSAVIPHRALAIDQAGVLFLSQDDGQHWEPVARQWTGRAIQVRAASPASDPLAPVRTFELMNEAGLTWQSADGKVWAAK